MKRWLLIGFGVLLILILVAIWAYLLFFDTSSSDDRFANFDFGGERSDEAPAEPAPAPTPTVATSSMQLGGLQQLTTDPVIGYQVIDRGTTSAPLIYYVAGGTGHIFSIDPNTGEKTRISNTTIPLSRAAAITPDGRYTLTQSSEGGGREFTVGSISTSSGSQQTTILSERIHTFTSSADNTFLYTTPTAQGLQGKEYDPRTRSTRTLFTLPFREATVHWGATANATHYIYPRASTELQGFLYSVTAGELTREPVAGFGLTALPTNEIFLYSHRDGAQYVTKVYDRSTDRHFNSPINTIPEKCVHRQSTSTEVRTLCAGTLDDLSHTQPDSWYRGEVTFSDILWSMSDDGGGVQFLIDTEAESGRTVDMIDPLFASATSVIFRNRLDGTLWLYDWR